MGKFNPPPRAVVLLVLRKPPLDQLRRQLLEAQRPKRRFQIEAQPAKKHD